jgi:hypothetical protein
MTICSSLSSEQTTAIKDQFAGVEITDADFDRIEVIGDLIRHIEIVDRETRPRADRTGRALVASILDVKSLRGVAI